MISPLSGLQSRQADVNVTSFYLCRIRLQVDTHWSALGFARRDVKTSLMPRAFDDFSDHQTVCEHFFLVST